MIVYFDGSTKHNAICIYPMNKGPITKTISKPATNNELEYMAAINAMLYLQEHHAGARSTIMGDSKLVVEQLNGNYKLRANNLKELYWTARDLVKSVSCSVMHVPRYQNLAGRYLETL